MRLAKGPDGFTNLVHNKYPDPGFGSGADPEEVRLLTMSSVVGDYEDSFDKPGSSYLWLGENHHLSREEVVELLMYLHRWLDTGSLKPPPDSITEDVLPRCNCGCEFVGMAEWDAHLANPKYHSPSPEEEGEKDAGRDSTDNQQEPTE